MDKKILSAAVVGAAVVAGAVAIAITRSSPAPHGATEAGKEQCFGVAKAGENGCAAVNGSHGCGGMSKVDNDGQEWTLVEAGSCLKMGGKLEAFEGTGKDTGGQPAADTSKGG
jgi:uncharacterized membrane protein